MDRLLELILIPWYNHRRREAISVALFGKKKPKADAKAEAVAVKVLDPERMNFHFPESDDEPTQQWSFFVNLSDKQAKLDNDERLVYDVRLTKDGDIIKGTKGTETLFEVGKRSKVFAELERYAGQTARMVSFKKYDGNYGAYYRTKLTFRVVVD